MDEFLPTWGSRPNEYIGAIMKICMTREAKESLAVIIVSTIVMIMFVLTIASIVAIDIYISPTNENRI